jgi:hypothetical protein
LQGPLFHILKVNFLFVGGVILYKKVVQIIKLNSMQDNFEKFILDNYSNLDGISLGRPFHADNIYKDYEINIPIKTLTRHGLITGSTGTGKSRAIQLIIEQLSKEGVPVFLSDIKGDMSGFSFVGNLEKITNRAKELNYTIKANKFPTNYWGNSDGLINFRMKLSDVDFVVLARLLELNSTQESHLGSVYKFAKDKKIEMRNLKDLNEIVSYLIKYPEKNIGTSSSSLSVIYRKLSNLEMSGLDKFFGLPAFEINDFISKKINILWLQNYQKEKYNTGSIVAFLLYRLYNELPEIGDVNKPKLVIFIDEAHQIFSNANESLVNLMVSILKQIRSKGVGVIFNTQNAEDIPEKILEQLGLKIQFALRAFSQKELQDIKGAVDSFPKTDFYNLKEEVKSLETGTAFVSVLNESGALLSPVKTIMYPPESLMDAPNQKDVIEANDINLVKKYQNLMVSNSLNLGSPLDNISISRGGRWQIKNYFLRKEDQKVKREVNKRNRELKKFLYLIIAILGLSAFIFFLFLVYSLMNKVL